ncbi:hypothetical protein QE382_001861 [Sphingobacterium zeae]|uniref:Uncharacterized protein n=1 Tax=Sphingobacterium zeae TaxID=1776859 RepID=A0ABU0U4J9_9SPHI|nr:hypothetical protein [Sphingobacterium zeae]
MELTRGEKASYPEKRNASIKFDSILASLMDLSWGN